MKKFRIGVFMGGRSLEKEVSFNSGRTVCDHLDTTQYDIAPIFQKDSGELYLLPWRFLHRGKISDFELRLDTEAKKISWDDLPSLVDFIYLTVYGRNCEDGTLQGIFELLKIPYLGSGVFACALGMNKAMQKDLLAAHGIIVPQGIVVDKHKAINAKKFEKEIIEQLKQKNLSFPLIIKPEAEGSSIGVSIVKKEDELSKKIHETATINPKHTQRVIIEEKIEGMETTCIVITDNHTGKYIPAPPTEIIPERGTEIFDYEQKYMPGRAERFTPARCSDEDIKHIQDISIKTMNVLGITNIGRIDVFLKKNGEIVVFDPNSLSGMGPSFFLFKQAAEIGLSHTQLINHLIETELIAYGMKKRISNKEEAKMNQEKIRVAVIMGGNNNEREISLESGRNVTYKLSPEKYEPTPLFLDSSLNLYALNQKMLVCNTTQEIETEIKQTKTKNIQWHELKKRFDFVFIGLHGAEGEDGTLQGALEMLNIPYNGSGVLTCALCMDKYKTNQFLEQHGFDTPKNLLVNKAEWQKNKKHIIDTIKKQFAFPYIIKPQSDGCSFFVQKITKDADITPAIEAILEKNNYAFIEEFVKGMELTVGCIGNDIPHAFIPSYTVTSHGVLSIEEKFLPGAGENQTPAPLSKEATSFVQKTIEDVYKALNCKGYCRIDCFYESLSQNSTKNHKLTILEVNTLPGMTPATCIFHQAAEAGMRPMEFIDLIVQLGLEEHKAKITNQKIITSCNKMETLQNQ